MAKGVREGDRQSAEDSEKVATITNDDASKYRVEHPVSVSDTPELIGGVTITVDGVDVTDRCFSANPQLGVAMCYRHNDEGQPLMDGEQVATERLTGSVRIVQR